MPDLSAADLPERDGSVLTGAGEQAPVRAVGDVQNHRIGLERAPTVIEPAHPARRQGERLGERLRTFERAVAAHRFDREQKAEIDSLHGLQADLYGLRGKLAGEGNLGLAFGAGALGYRLGFPLEREVALTPGGLGGGKGADQQGHQGHHGDATPPS